MLLRAHAGIDLAPGGRQQIDLHAALSKARLHGLGDGDKRRLVLHVQREVRVFNARFGENGFRFCRVKLKRVVFQRARQADRQEALMNKVLAFQQIFGDAFIIDQPARGFPERRVVQQRVGAVAGVKHQVILLGGRNAQHLNARLAVQGAYLICSEIARHVRITLLDQQSARSRVGDVFNDDAFELRRTAGGGVVGFQHDSLMRLIDAHFERSAARRVHFQPGVTKVIILHVCRDLLFIDDGGNRRGENIQRHRRANVRRPVKLEGMVVHLFQLAGDVARVPAQHVQDECRGFVQRHGAGVRENHVFRAQRVAGGESGIGLKFDRQRFCCRVRFPAFCQNWGDFFRVIAVRLYQALIQARHGLDAGKLVGFGRVEAHDVIKPLGNNQRVGRSSGVDSA